MAVCAQLDPLPAEPVAADGRVGTVCQSDRATPSGNLYARGYSSIYHLQIGISRRCHEVSSDDISRYELIVGMQNKGLSMNV